MSRRFQSKWLLWLAVAVPVGLSGQTSDSLGHYLETAVRNNPGVQAAFSLYRAALQKIPQAGAWQDPQLEAGFFPEPMETAGGRQVAQLEWMQMFPWFGTRKAARTEAEHRAKMAYEQFRETCDRMWLEVSVQWFTLGRLQQELRYNRENRALLTLLEELALRKVVSSDLSDLLRIRLEIMETEENTERLLSEIAAEKVRFNVLLNRPFGSAVQLPDSLLPLPFLWDETVVKEKVRAQNPLLGAIAEEGSAYGAKAEMDRKMGYPMFGVGLQYMWMNKSRHSQGMEGMNGKEMWMPMVSVTIPVFRRKYRAMRQESTLLQQASREKYADALNQIEADLYRARSDLDNAERKIALYRKQSELAQSVYNLAVQEFTSGRGGLAGVIRVQRQLLEYKIKTVEAVAAYNTTAANLQKWISFSEEQYYEQE